MNVLIIGANGRTGRRVAQLLLATEHQPVAMVRHPDQREFFDGLHLTLFLHYFDFYCCCNFFVKLDFYFVSALVSYGIINNNIPLIDFITSGFFNGFRYFGACYGTEKLSAFSAFSFNYDIFFR